MKCNAYRALHFIFCIYWGGMYMACFTAPLAEAVIVKAVEKSIEKKGGKEASDKIPLARKVKWLSTMLFGGSALLAFEHVWHCMVPFPYCNEFPRRYCRDA